jgi:hypothetical protein
MTAEHWERRTPLALPSWEFGHWELDCRRRGLAAWKSLA